MSTFSKEQKIQEDQYKLPYHWFFRREDFRGRKYFGYTSLALQKAYEYGLNKKTADIIDVGCGDGRFIETLRQEGYGKVVGLDYSKKALRFAEILMPETRFI